MPEPAPTLSDGVLRLEDWDPSWSGIWFRVTSRNFQSGTSKKRGLDYIYEAISAQRGVHTDTYLFPDSDRSYERAAFRAWWLEHGGPLPIPQSVREARPHLKDLPWPKAIRLRTPNSTSNRWNIKARRFDELGDHGDPDQGDTGRREREASPADRGPNQIDLLGGGAHVAA